MIPENSSLIEIASGTGDLAFKLAPKLSHYVGIEKSESMARGSQSRLARKNGYDYMQFMHGDGARLDGLVDKSFDLALISLALHEMPRESRLPVLKEMKRCAQELILIDYAAPLPKNLKGSILHFVEFLAGGDHYRGFKSYQQQGGLDKLITEAGLSITREDSSLDGGIRIVKVIS